jgi:hypothetical protein
MRLTNVITFQIMEPLELDVTNAAQKNEKASISNSCFIISLNKISEYISYNTWKMKNILLY